MPSLWMPGATRLDVGDHAPTDGGPAKAIAHITWDRNATAAKPQPLVPYENLRDYFGKNTAGRAAAPHVLWDPFTGRLTQFLPANSRSKSLADAPGGTRTNRAGSVVIQVEALFFPYCVVGGKAYARLVDTPCKGWPELLAWVRSWGVRDAWPMGRPTSFAPNRSTTVWAEQGGWYAHAQVPENDHQDPGSWPAFTEEDDDMALTAAQAKQLTDVLALVKRIDQDQQIDPWRYKGKGELDAWALLNGLVAKADALASVNKQLVEAVAKLAAGLGDLDPAAIVTELRQAIESVEVRLDVPDTQTS